MTQNINLIQIGKTRNTLKPRRWCSLFKPDNLFEESTPSGTTGDGTKYWDNVDRWFRPSGEFTFNFLDDSEFVECVQIIKGDPFCVRYFDPELRPTGLWVVRFMKANSVSLAAFLRLYQNRYAGVTQFNFKCESVYTYDNYQQLEDKAENDLRF